MTSKAYIKHILLSLLIFFSNAGVSSNNEHKALLFFYAGYCHYCDGVAESLVKLQKKYNIKIVASSLDQKILPQFTNFLKNDALIRKFKISSVPTLIAIDFDKQQFEVLLEQYEDYDVINSKVSFWINNA